jgi:hypothetical protein
MCSLHDPLCSAPDVPAAWVQSSMEQLAHAVHSQQHLPCRPAPVTAPSQSVYEGPAVFTLPVQPSTGHSSSAPAASSFLSPAGPKASCCKLVVGSCSAMVAVLAMILPHIM